MIIYDAIYKNSLLIISPDFLKELIAMSFKLSKVKQNTILTALLFLSLTGCASRSYINEYKYDDKYSYALNNMLAAGTMIEDGEIKDVEIDRAQEAGDDAVEFEKSINGSDNFQKTLTSMEAAATLSGFTPPPIGVSSGFHGGMLLLSLLDSPYKPSFIRDHMFAYMPVGMADSPEEAKKVLANMLEDAVFKALPDDVEYEKIVNHWKPIFGPKSTQNLTVIKGGACSRSYIHLYGDMPSVNGCRLSISLTDGNPPVMKSPDWLGGGEAYFFHPDFYRASSSERAAPDVWMWVSAEKGLGMFEEIREENDIRENMGDLSRAALLFRISSHMPSWFYIYIAPKKTDPIPKILNQGNVHYFAKYK